MALTKAQLREILSGAGADSEKIADAVDKIISGHTASIEALREKVDTLQSKADEAEKLQKELEALKADDTGKKLAEVQKEYDDFKASVEKEKSHRVKEQAFREMLKDLGIPERHHAKIVKYSDVDGLEITEEGKIKGVRELAKGIKEDWADHFETSKTEGAKTPNPPSGQGSGATMTKKEIMQIKNTAERQTALRAYLEAGGASSEGKE